MTKDELKKSVEEILEELELAQQEESSEEVEKAMPTKLDANGGEDKIKAGTPMSDKQAEKAKKSEEEDSEMEKAEDKMKETAEKEAKEEVKEHEKDMHKKKKMEKSEEEAEEKVEKSQESSEEVQEEVIELSQEEVELIKAWREEQEKDSFEKSEEKDKEDDFIQKAFQSQNEELKKSLEAQNELIKSLSEQVTKLASQPAYDTKAISSLEPIEKAQPEEEVISKAQKLDTLLELQKSGSDVRSTHIAELEATGKISNPSIARLLENELKKSKN